ncbi:UDP-N-acetylmuramate dehydrogenase [Nonlabens dokdonensis]|jgi:UDP-N-acetylmuramate dehydrogenase|uniref:UDP-N-acetylenolpyruvoylglucosamine reductase n=2 Tax=Nonlabens dokdonensis TaxID=328515 RepID=L7WA05_NONDD|nr:UDP-N-acetylmuramate reductase/dehydrogenase [Nonlabens dokdonensis DSW-6]PZX43395.1 UDP-N-acetylmuramate dehydrogenase [Nonlabens dokdonensis]
MIEVQHHFPLKEFNTFGISAFAKAYTAVASLQQLKEVLGFYKETQVFLLGGGSNMLLINDIQKPVVHVLLKGIEIIKSDGSDTYLKVMAGENWHDFVLYCIKNNFAGIENLSLIPGNVGTSPIQNIGAYGVELKDSFYSCDVIDIKTLEEKTLSLTDCNFGYRDSIFKNEALGKYVITSVTFKLTDLNKPNNYQLKTDYGAIQSELARLDETLSIQTVSKAVINIRSSKLPDPKIIGNSGSFFKNPIIKRSLYDDLVRMHPEMPAYDVDHDHVKVPAGWLIDQSGFKGKRYGDAGIHEKQALVLVNYGNATGQEILDVSHKIQKAVYDRYGIEIETEVNLINE